MTTSYKVGNVVVRNGRKRLALKNQDGKSSHIEVHQFAPVGQGNSIIVDPANSTKIFVENAENDKDPIRISPHFEKLEQLRIGDKKYEIKITEVVCEADLDDLRFLEIFHYRGSESIVVLCNSTE
jgi:hypothetical protein